jgi:hypothetical protein
MSRKIGMNRLTLAAPVVMGLAYGLLFSSEALARTCDPPLTASIHTVEHAVDLLPIDGADPSAVTQDTENIRWMRGELELIREACSRGSDVEAVWRLEQVQSRMTLALKLATRRQTCRVAARVGGKCPLTRQDRGARRKANTHGSANAISGGESETDFGRSR